MKHLGLALQMANARAQRWLERHDKAVVELERLREGLTTLADMWEEHSRDPQLQGKGMHPEFVVARLRALLEASNG